VVAVTALSGDRVELPAFPPGTTMRELREAVKRVWKMPLATQCFVIDSKIVEARDGQQVAVVFQDALQKSHPERTVEVAVVRGALPEQAQQAVDTTLLVATARGALEDMREALAEGANPDTCSSVGSSTSSRTVAARRGPTPLMLAHAAEDKEAIELLISALAEKPNMKPQFSSLGIAFRNNDLQDVVRILGQKADPNMRLRRGDGVRDTGHGTPLHACCALHRLPGVVPVAELLLRLKADPCDQDEEGDTPLAHARYFQADDLFEVLQQRGGRLDGPYYSIVHRAGRTFLGWR